MIKTVKDKDLGIITIQTNLRAKRYTLRVKDGAVLGTMPVYGELSTMLAFIESSRPKLLLALQRPPLSQNILNEASVLQTSTFNLHIFRTDRDNFYMNLNEGTLHIACPEKTDFEDERVQKLLKGLIEQALRHEAKRILPGRLFTLSKQFGFTYSSVKINNSKSRWGSCSGKGSINLSLSLMLLPDHLSDYVLLHELCHTKEMNHSERFWQLMDQVTNNKALALRKELKGYKML
ncbi:MAG: M48 family metallopeptidase [Tannerellaceae bacterium]|jgi:predicted metal-dependent hydrolase|nr:M48 family metallopeptidase [Tannerellaceae bacterium]